MWGIIETQASPSAGCDHRALNRAHEHETTLIWRRALAFQAGQSPTLSNAELSGGRSAVQALGNMPFRILSRRSTAMLGAPVRCSVELGGRRRRGAATKAGHGPRWMSDARARGPAHSRYALPNDSIAVQIGRCACPRRPRLSNA